MKLNPLSLKKWVNYSLTNTQLAEQLTLAGFETTLLSDYVNSFSRVVVGEVICVEPHPNADRLKLCTVDCGPSYGYQHIICGASNVRQGLKVATALIGAKLPNNFLIQERKLRGVVSQGMLCSIQELGLESMFSHEVSKGNIWELDNTLPIGVDFWHHLELSDTILEVAVLPNRGDCLSTLGLAREIAILNRLDCRILEDYAIESTLKERLPIEMKASKAAPRYTGRVIHNINVEAKTPWWIVKRLWEGDIRSINAVVDITNYVLLECGAPLHAFDKDHVSGAICVRYAQSGEKLTLLNEKRVTLDDTTLIIADQQGPLAMAGIMGGTLSAVSSRTQNIFLESAYFTPDAIANKARHYGFTSESSHRFERGVDPHLCEYSLNYATALILSICGGEAGPMSQVESLKHLSTQPAVQLSHVAINRLLGTQWSTDEVIQKIKQLKINYQTNTTDSKDTLWHLTPPSFRFDLKEEVDLIEELARIFGYAQLDGVLPSLPINFQAVDHSKTSLANWRRLLANEGFYEAINYSFVSLQDQKALDPNKEPVALENPISSELDVLRTQLWQGLFTTLRNNYHHHSKSHRFFECGTVFIQENGRIIEKTHLAGIMTGTCLPEQWSEKAKNIDFFDLKAIVHHSLQLLDPTGSYTYQLAEHPALHPKESSQLLKEGKIMGWLGSLHPSLYSHFDVKTPVYLFELQQPYRVKAPSSIFQSISRLPSMRRDIAFWVDQSITFECIHTTILNAAGPYLKDIQLFDVYSSKENTSKRSLALGLIWQHPEMTLTDSQVNQWQTDVLQALQKAYQIGWRSDANNEIS